MPAPDLPHGCIAPIAEPYRGRQASRRSLSNSRWRSKTPGGGLDLDLPTLTEDVILPTKSSWFKAIERETTHSEMQSTLSSTDATSVSDEEPGLLREGTEPSVMGDLRRAGEVPLPGPVPESGEPAVTLTIVGARGLRDADWAPGAGKSDTYIVVKMGGQEIHKTAVIKDTLEPFWRETVVIPDWTVGQDILFSLYDEDIASSDYLGKVNLESHVFETVGFNNEVEIQESGTDLPAYLRLKLKLGGKPLPPGPNTVVTVQAYKGTCKSWGLDLDTQDNVHLYVTEVRAGPVAQANVKLPPEEQIMKGDFIQSVNGVTGNPAALLNEFKLSTQALIQVVRCVETTIFFRAADKKLPLGIQFSRRPAGEAVVVMGVDEDSAVDQFNRKQRNEMLQINAGDRIVAVGGKRGKAADIIRRLGRVQKHSKAVQMVLLRPTSDLAMHHFDLH